jgi:hypothetical protein
MKMKMNVSSVKNWFDESYGLSDHIPVCWSLHSGSKLLVITGENASGKSMIRRFISSLAKKNNIEPISVSPELKQNGGIASCFIFGDESWKASGCIAANVVMGAISNSQKREHQHIVILDEPDMGMSDNLAAGCSKKITEYCSISPKNLKLFVVITHRKAMMEVFQKEGCSHMRVGDNKSDLFKLCREKIKPADPEEVIEKSMELFRTLTKIFNGK